MSMAPSPIVTSYPPSKRRYAGQFQTRSRPRKNRNRMWRPNTCTATRQAPQLLLPQPPRSFLGAERNCGLRTDTHTDRNTSSASWVVSTLQTRIRYHPVHVPNRSRSIPSSISYKSCSAPKLAQLLSRFSSFACQLKLWRHASSHGFPAQSHPSELPTPCYRDHFSPRVDDYKKLSWRLLQSRSPSELSEEGELPLHAARSVEPGDPSSCARDLLAGEFEQDR